VAVIGGVGVITAEVRVSPSVVAQAPCRNAAIRSPFRGDVLRGTVSILGSARIDNFSFYKLEWATVAAPEQWSAVSTTISTPVRNGLLDRWDSTRLADGRYRLKLTVVDASAQEVCRIFVEDLTIGNGGTPTPTGSATAARFPGLATAAAAATSRAQLSPAPPASPVIGSPPPLPSATFPPSPTPVPSATPRPSVTPVPPTVTEVPTDAPTDAPTPQPITATEGSDGEGTRASPEAATDPGAAVPADGAGPTPTLGTVAVETASADPLAVFFSPGFLARAFGWSFGITLVLALFAWRLMARRAA